MASPSYSALATLHWRRKGNRMVDGTPDREQLLREMEELHEQMQSKTAPGVTQEELEAALDEACAEVRYEPRE